MKKCLIYTFAVALYLGINATEAVKIVDKIGIETNIPVVKLLDLQGDQREQVFNSTQDAANKESNLEI